MQIYAQNPSKMHVLSLWLMEWYFSAFSYFKLIILPNSVVFKLFSGYRIYAHVSNLHQNKGLN